jgi:branched-chain amino acid transport system permease protein
MGDYAAGIVTLLAVNCIAAMGVSLFTGFTGIFTLGHAGYMAIGAYTSAILIIKCGVPWFLAIIAGGFVAMFFAYLIGLPTLKLVGDYYTIASLGLGEAIRLVIENWNSVTRGARGYPGIPRYTTMPVAVVFLVLLAIGMFFIINSNYGRAFKACRDDYVAASLLGFHTSRYRVLSLAISGFYCGVSGALLAGFMSFIQPVMFDMAKSTELVSIVVFGGLGSMSGCLIGTAILTLVIELFRSISQYRMLIYGLVLVMVMVIRPEGIMGANELNSKTVRHMLSRAKVVARDTVARFALIGFIIGLPLSYCFQPSPVSAISLTEYLRYIPSLLFGSIKSGAPLHSSVAPGAASAVLIVCAISAFLTGIAGYIIKQLKKIDDTHAAQRGM